MTDQQIPADDLRRFIARCRTAVNGRGSILLDELEALLPGPPRPTLADMTLDERDECVGMQADLAQGDRVVILDGTPDHDGLVQVLEKSLDVHSPHPDDVTPRPDLPRLEWPGDKKPAPAPALPDGWRLADHPKYGRVIVTNPTPNRDGYVYVVFPDDGNLMGYDWDACPPSALTYIDQEDEDAPTNTLAVGTVIESADDPRLAALPVGSVLSDCDGETVAKRTEAWVGPGYTPEEDDGAEFGPWTVLHIPKEADQ